jgi:hypothetical protein
MVLVVVVLAVVLVIVVFAVSCCYIYCYCCILRFHCGAISLVLKIFFLPISCLTSISFASGFRQTKSKMRSTRDRSSHTWVRIRIASLYFSVDCTSFFLLFFIQFLPRFVLIPSASSSQ